MGASEKKFIKLFESLAYTQSYHTVFSDFLDYALVMMRHDKTEADIEELSNRWPKQDDRDKLKEMLLVYSEIADNDGAGFHDGLGDLFMELLSKGKNGQFFTPQCICDMMAMMLYGEPVDGTYVSDPACGSGRMLLAAAKMNRNQVFIGSDNDIVCCKMTVLNMLMNTMVGEVAWMNTLSMEHWRSWHIRRVLLDNGHYLPYYFVTGPGETTLIRKAEFQEKEKPPEDIKPEQLSLF